MKRELFGNVLAIPYSSGSAIDRSGFLSAVIGTTADPGAEITVKVEHSDDGATFSPVTDKQVFPGYTTKKDEDGQMTFTVPEPSAEDGAVGEEAKSAETDDVATTVAGAVNIDVDLVGLKNYVKFTVTGGGSLAVVLGDSATQPV